MDTPSLTAAIILLTLASQLRCQHRPKSPYVDCFFRNALENYRPQLKHFDWGTFEFENNKLDNYIEHIIIENLETFVLYLKSSYWESELNNGTAMWDRLDITGEYHLNNLDVPGPFQLFGTGDIRVELHKVRLWLAADIFYCNQTWWKSFCIKKVNTLDLTWEAHHINMSNVNGYPATSVFHTYIHDLINTAFTDYVQIHKAQFLQHHTTAFVKWLNNIFSNSGVQRLCTTPHPPDIADPSV